MNERNLPMAEERYRALPLIRRLLTEQGLVHWRKYAIAFTLMAVSAGCARRIAALTRTTAMHTTRRMGRG